MEASALPKEKPFMLSGTIGIGKPTSIRALNTDTHIGIIISHTSFLPPWKNSSAPSSPSVSYYSLLNITFKVSSFSQEPLAEPSQSLSPLSLSLSFYWIKGDLLSPGLTSASADYGAVLEQMHSFKGGSLRVEYTCFHPPATSFFVLTLNTDSLITRIS